MTPATDVAQLRQGLYRFFGGALAPPEPRRLEELAAAAEYLEDRGLDEYSFYREWRRLASMLSSGTTAIELAPEYVRLFASGADGALCPPIESYYRARGRREAIAEIVAAIQHDYRDLGLTTTGLDTAPDHVATQFEIMSTLCAREAAAWEMMLLPELDSLLGAEQKFLHRHLGSWLPMLRTRVHAAGPGDFYAALADAMHSFVVHDQDLINGLRRRAGAAA